MLQVRQITISNATQSHILTVTEPKPNNQIEHGLSWHIAASTTDTGKKYKLQTRQQQQQSKKKKICIELERLDVYLYSRKRHRLQSQVSLFALNLVQGLI